MHNLTPRFGRGVVSETTSISSRRASLIAKFTLLSGGGVGILKVTSIQLSIPYCNEISG